MKFKIKKNFICLFIAFSMIFTNLCSGLETFKVSAQEKQQMPIELKNKLNFVNTIYNSNGARQEVSFNSSAMNKGIVYAFREGVGCNALITFDLYGHQIWKYDMKEVSTCNNHPNFVFDDKDTVYLTIGGKTDERYIYAINSDGSEKWKKKFEGKGSENVLLKDDNIIINITNKEKEAFTYALNKETGDVTWKFKVDNEFRYEGNYQYLALAKDGTIISYACNSWRNEKGILYAIDSNGNEKWKYEYKGSNATALLGHSGEEVYVTDNLNEIKALNVKDGKIINDNPLNGYSTKSEKYKNIRLTGWKFSPDNSLHIRLSSGNHYEYKIIDSEGKEKFKKEKFMDPLAIDKEGYSYFSKRKGGGMNITVLDPEGKEVYTVPPIGGSATPEYDLYVKGNILLGARTHSTDVLGFKIIRNGIEENPNSIEIVEKNKVLNLKVNNTLAVVVKDKNGDAMLGEDIQWTSSNPTIATVNEKEEIFTLKEGKVTLTATISGTNISDSTEVTIKKGESIPTTIEIEPKEIEVELLKSGKFKAVIKDQLGIIMPDAKVNWSCNINYHNVIDKEGNIIPTKEGEYDVKAWCDGYPEVETSAKIKVVKNPSKLQNVYPIENVLRVGESIQLLPINQYGEVIEDGNFTWKSLNDKVAEVDENGKVTGKSKGKASIKITDNNDKSIEQTKEVSIVDSFANTWSSEDLISGQKLIKHNDNIYLSGRDGIVAIDKEGKQQWKKDLKNLNNVEIGDDGNIYVTCFDYDNNAIKVSCIENNGKIKWSKDFKNTSYSLDIKQGKDKTIYFLMGKDLYALSDEYGSQKWKKTLEAEGEKLILDNNNIVVDCQQNGKKILILDSKGDKLNEIGLDDKLVSFKNNTAYYFNQDTVTQIYSLNAKIKDGISWNLPLQDKDEKYDSWSDNKCIDIDNKGNIYFATKLNSNAVVYCVDDLGKLIWRKDFTNLLANKQTYAKKGDLALDNEGNAYISLSKQEKEGWSTKTISNNIFKINNRGNIEGYVSYDKDSFDKFNCILVNEKDGKIYATSGKKVSAFSMGGDIKLYVNSIDINASSQNVLVGEQLKLTAVVKNQLGIEMPKEKVKWTSSNEEIASVDENGLIEGLKEGEVDITAISLTDDKVKKVYNVNIVKPSELRLSKEEIKNKMNKVVGYYKKQGIPQGDWVAFGLNAAGENINKAPYTKFGRSYIEALEDNLSGKDELGLITEYERTSLGILAAGKDPHNFAGMNLIEKIYNYKDLSQGNNAAMWALIAYDAADSKIPEDAKYTRDALIKHLLDNKAGDGWTIGAGKPDVDMTSMGLYALAPYKDRKDVKPHIEKAIKWLKTQQLENGGFGGWGTELNPESTAQAIMALTACGIDPQGEEFTKSDGNPLTPGNPVTAMLQFQLPNGSFEHVKGVGTDEGFATPQGLQALASLNDFYKNEVSKIFYHIPYDKNDGTDTPAKKLNFKVETVAKENFKLGEKVKVEVNVTNKEDKENMATLIVALYNKDTKEMENYSFVSKKVKASATEDMSAGFVIPEKGNYEVKAFVWDDLVKINVLSEVIKGKVDKK